MSKTGDANAARRAAIAAAQQRARERQATIGQLDSMIDGLNAMHDGLMETYARATTPWTCSYCRRTDARGARCANCGAAREKEDS